MGPSKTANKTDCWLCHFQGWQKQSPVSFQHFSNINYKQPPVSYLCEYAVNDAQGPFNQRDDFPIFDINKCKNLSEVKEENQKRLQPNLPSLRPCILLLMSNLAQPEWISIVCNKKLLSTVVCSTSAGNYDTEAIENREQPTETACRKSNLMMQTWCLLFVWFQAERTNSSTNFHVKHLCSPWQGKTIQSLSDEKLQVLTVLADAVIHMSLLVIFPDQNKTHATQVLFERQSEFFEPHTETIIVPITEAQGFVICDVKKMQVLFEIESLVFRCTNGAFTSNLFFCDFVEDCPDGSDEANCFCMSEKTTTNSPASCKQFHESLTNPPCSPFYYTGSNLSCTKFFELEWQEDNESSVELLVLECSNGTEIDISLKDDLVPDCQKSEDELNLLALLENETIFSCQQPDALPCLKEHSKCFNLSEACSFQLNKFGHLIPCRNGGHLQDCEHFNCVMKFKCLHSYCVPWISVCNGIWDCPVGEDELSSSLSTENELCKNLYKCRHTTHTCVHLGQLCDQQSDCPSSDDEIMCSLLGERCPFHCDCLLLAIVCRNITLGVASNSFRYISVFIVSSSQVFPENTMKTFPHAYFFILKANNVKYICKKFHSNKLLKIDLSFNVVSAIDSDCLAQVYNLKSLALNDNEVTTLLSCSFANLSNLLLLNLSNNPLRSIPQRFLQANKEIKSFHLENVFVSNLSVRAFEGVASILIHTNDYHLCCVAPLRNNCTCHVPWYFGCLNILPKGEMKISFIVISVLIFFLNTFSILTHFFIKDQKSQAYNVTVIFINSNELLCATYLVIVWTADIYFAGTYMVREEDWRSGFVCFLAFYSLVTFVISTQALLIHFSFSRLKVVSHPFDTKFKEVKSVLKMLSVILFASLVFGASITLMVKFTAICLPLSLCTPFVDPTKSLVTAFLTWLVVVTQLVTSVTILVLHILLVTSLKESQKRTAEMKRGHESNTALIIQLILLTVSNMLCWFPTNIIYVLTMFLKRYPTELAVWTVVGVTPINSIVNPSLFLILQARNCIRKSQKKPKHVLRFPI